MSVSVTPWMASVTGGAANTPQSLQTLLLALGTSRKPSFGVGPLRAAYIQIQANPNGGGNKYYIGSFSDMAATDCGVQLAAAGIWQPPSVHNNLYRLDQIYLMSDHASDVWNINYITK